MKLPARKFLSPRPFHCVGAFPFVSPALFFSLSVEYLFSSFIIIIHPSIHTVLELPFGLDIHSSCSSSSYSVPVIITLWMRTGWKLCWAAACSSVVAMWKVVSGPTIFRLFNNTATAATVTLTVYCQIEGSLLVLLLLLGGSISVGKFCLGFVYPPRSRN